MIKSGKYIAKITDYGMSETKAGDAQVWVEFSEVNGEGKITWFGGTKSEKQAEITARQLVVMEFQGGNFSDMMKKGQLNQEAEYQLVCEDETYNGKTKTKVKFINKAGGAQSMKRIADTNAAKKADTFSNLLAKAKAEAGFKPKVKNHAPGAEDVGF